MQWWYPIGPILFFSMPVLLFVGWVAVLHIEEAARRRAGRKAPKPE